MVGFPGRGVGVGMVWGGAAGGGGVGGVTPYPLCVSVSLFVFFDLARDVETLIFFRVSVCLSAC